MSRKSKLESEIKVNEERWSKESELTKKLMDLRKKKFAGSTQILANAVKSAAKSRLKADLQCTDK